MTQLLITDIGELITLAPLAKARRTTRVRDDDLGRERGAWLAINNGQVAAHGTGNVPSAFASWPRHSARGGLVMPGLVDAHTHLVFGGSRADEFAMRLAGKSYQEIAAAGGGISSSMRATREASDATLVDKALAQLQRAIKLGITTLEVKTGYGLSVPDELRLLRVYKQVAARATQRLVVTCLALHARSPEHADCAAFARACAADLLPVVAKEQLATYVDAFVEAGYFSVADVEAYMQTAKRLGLGVRLHADEFSDAGGAAAAARWGAASADHLQFASEAGIKAMAAAGVTAVMLPGTSLYTGIPFTKARRFAEAGCPVAIATDFNPGSALVDNLAMLATVAAVQGGLTLPEAIAAVTYVPAVSLGLGTTKGALAPGFDADVLVYEGLGSADDWLADCGRTLPSNILIAGTPAS
jgi:imidazolonepropionase